MNDDIDTDRVKPPLPEQQQDVPGTTAAMDPRPDHGETSYRGCDLLAGRAAVITGGDSGIGRAVAIAFAREGADVLISYLNETEDAQETARLVEEAGRRAVLVPGDVGDAAHCREIVARAVEAFGRIDILVNNAAHQASISELEDFSTGEWEPTFRTNIDAMFHLCKAAVPHMKPGAAIINTASIQAFRPKPDAPRLRRDQGGRRQLHARPGAARGREGDPRQRGRAGADLDAAHPRDDARGEGGEVRGEHAARPSGPTGRARGRLRAPGL